MPAEKLTRLFGEEVAEPIHEATALRLLFGRFGSGLIRLSTGWFNIVFGRISAGGGEQVMTRLPVGGSVAVITGPSRWPEYRQSFQGNP